MRPKKVILLVDVNEQALSVRTFLLETHGYCVIRCTYAEGALEVVADSVPGAIDLLLCDLDLDTMDGNELVRRAKQLQPDLRMMIVSAVVNSWDRGTAADVFLPKAVNIPTEVVERVRILVKRKRGPKKLRNMGPPVQLAQEQRAVA